MKKDCIDGATFDQRSQADLICMLNTNLEILELAIFQIKALLKEPNEDNFEELKKRTIERVTTEHKEFMTNRSATE